MNSKQAAQAIYLIRQQIKDLEKQAAQISQEFFTKRDLDNYVEGEFLVSVQRNARFDPALASEVLTDEEYEQVLVTKPDSAAAKDRLAPVRYRACQKEGTPKVVITLLPDEED